MLAAIDLDMLHLRRVMRDIGYISLDFRELVTPVLTKLTSLALANFCPIQPHMYSVTDHSVPTHVTTSLPIQSLYN